MIIYAEFEINITILNKKLKKDINLNAYIHLIIVLIRVRNIKNNVYEIKEYVIYKIYFLEGKNKNRNIIIVKIAL